MKIQLRTREVEVESLTINDVDRFDSDGTFTKCPMDGLGLYKSKEAREAGLTVVFASLRRAAPDLTIEALGDEITIDNFRPLILAVMGMTKLTAKEGAGAGEG